jgi:PAS domain S-box-containing protein
VVPKIVFQQIARSSLLHHRDRIKVNGEMRRFWNEVSVRLTRSRLPGGFLLALSYVIAGRLGLLFAVPPGYATAIFPPAGVAMAATFIGGSVMLPWIFIGSFLLNIWISCVHNHRFLPISVSISLAIAAASSLQAGLGGWALRRLIGHPAALDNHRDLLRFFLGVPVLCLVSATVSLGSMAAIGTIGEQDFGKSWLTWWLGDTFGVLVSLPIVMVVMGEPRDFWRSRARSVALPMMLCFALFVAIFIRVRAWEIHQSELEFRLISQQTIDNIGAQLSAQEVLLRQLAVSFDGPAPLSRHDFSVLANNVVQNFPAIKAIEWAPRIAEEQRREFEAERNREAAGFQIRDRDATGHLQRAGTRSTYYPITYVQPLRGNEAALGFDLISEPILRSAIVHAVATGTVTATAPIQLVQGPSDRTGVLLMRSVPRGRNGAGVAVTVLNSGTFVSSLLGSTSRLVGIEILDQKANRPLFDTLSTTGAKPLFTRSIAFGGRPYGIMMSPTPFYVARHRTWLSQGVLVIGILSTSLLGALLMLGTGERQRFARLLSERTRERDRIWQVSEDLLGVGNFEGYFISVNPAWTRTLGWSDNEIKAMHVSELRHPDDAQVAIEGRRRLADGVQTARMENRFRRKDGSYQWIYWTMTADLGLIYVIGRNVTADREAVLAHRQTEEQLHQLQKMESVGRLTGGIAHDFNNFLTVIIGNVELAQRWLQSAPERAEKAVAAARDGAMRAAALTQRLLAYAQRQPLRPCAVDLNMLIFGMADLIRRTQSEIISYQFAPSEQIPLCFCDTNQLETALLNLVINACDAMPRGGRLRIETAVTNLDDTTAGARGISVGTYVLLSVIDTGIGMSAEILARVFEPFFTTKGLNKGTGLGLSMVYGFVKQSKGHIEINSVPGEGTTIRLFLPSLSDERKRPNALSNVAPFSSAKTGRAEKTILVVDDDAGVRSYVVEMLLQMNYHVVQSANAESALSIITDCDMRIDLLLTDVMMPDVNGRELVTHVRAVRPNLRVLFMTGYSHDTIIHHGHLDLDVELIEKPFGYDALAARLQAIFDADDTATPITDSDRSLSSASRD